MRARHESPNSTRPLPRYRDGYLIPVEAAPLNTCPLRNEIHRLRALVTVPPHRQTKKPSDDGLRIGEKATTAASREHGGSEERRGV